MLGFVVYVVVIWWSVVEFVCICELVVMVWVVGKFYGGWMVLMVVVDGFVVDGFVYLGYLLYFFGCLDRFWVEYLFLIVVL